ncbi:MAG: hypothetical protein Q8K85_12275 [Hyphomicrobium sp.]|nr:hypothetical protein [Hyphomicrobium sp.]
MNLLPVRVVSLASDLPPGALADLLRGVVGDGLAAPFAGAVAADGFVITRINEFRSTVMPQLRGSLVAKAGGGTGVILRLRPPATVIVFMVIWLAFLAAVAAVIVIAHARGTGRSLLWLLAPAGLGAFCWLLMTAVFTADARWAVEHLVESVPALHRD